jgi:ABC-type nitrate/sulfonate/bicarbonate transport system substrate-binding protein
MRRQPPKLTLLAAPLPAGARYGGKPIYFSDVVVRRDSPYQTFADLRGVTWGYNEPGSQSGYNVVRPTSPDTSTMLSTNIEGPTASMI